MTLRLYLRYKKMFESRYKPSDLGYSRMLPMKKDIRGFDLFFKIYSKDTNVKLTQWEDRIDKDIRYSTVDGEIGTHIKILNFPHNISRVEKFGQFEIIVKFIQKQPLK